MKIKFDITGMSCAACSARVEKVTAAVPGVENVEVNLLAGTMQVDVADETCIKQIIAAVVNAGYGAFRKDGAVPQEKTQNRTPDELKEMRVRITVSALFLIILMYFTMGHMIGLPLPYWYMGNENALVATLLQFFLTLPPVYLNRSYYTKGFKALINKAPNMDSLIAVGSGASLIYGIFALFAIAYAMGHQDFITVALYRKNLYFDRSERYADE